MYKYFVIVFCSLLFVPSVKADALSDFRTISVSGSAEIKVTPDRAVISLTIEDRGINLQETRKKNDQTVKAFTKHLNKDLKISQDHIQTDHISVYPEYQYCNYDNDRNCDPLKVRYYTVVQNMQIQVNELSDYEPILNKAFEVGISQINQVQFVSSELRKYKDQAREKAAIAAKEKADAVAKTLGMTVKKPLNISLNVPDYNHYGYQSARRNVIQMESGGGDSGLAVGQMAISADVSVVFEIE
jgi:hypothetical protein